MGDSIYEKIIFTNEDKGEQYRLTVSEFRDSHYLHLRKYFLSYEGEWIPSSEGASIPAEIANIRNVLHALVDICAKAELEYLVKEVLGEPKQ